MSFFDHLPRLGYSRDLHQHLKGLSASTCNDYQGDAIYQLTAIVLLAVSAAIMLNFYYGIFNRPRYTHRLVWLLQLLAASVFTGVFAYNRAAAGLPEEKHCASIRFSTLDCLLFGVTVGVYTWLICFLFSMLLKWKSTVNKKIPF